MPIRTHPTGLPHVDTGRLLLHLSSGGVAALAPVYALHRCLFAEFATVARMKETFDNTFGEREERDERREFMCVAVIVLVGTSLGFLFVFVRESLGLKM